MGRDGDFLVLEGGLVWDCSPCRPQINTNSGYLARSICSFQSTLRQEVVALVYYASRTNFRLEERQQSMPDSYRDNSGNSSAFRFFAVRLGRVFFVIIR